jgi:hypothetical protein
MHPKRRSEGTELSDAAPATCAEGIEDRVYGRSSFEGSGRGAYSSTLSFVSWFGLWFLLLSVHQVQEAKSKVEDDNAAELLRRPVVVHAEGYGISRRERTGLPVGKNHDSCPGLSYGSHTSIWGRDMIPT